jgi:diaminopimelate epimerase
MKILRYSGAGNDFAVIDGRGEDLAPARDAVSSLCEGLDGLIILRESAAADFAMEFYNPDGSSGMMCGNGGRCVVAFADDLGIRPADGRIYRFEAPDGLHTAEILSREGALKTVRLAMRDVSGLRVLPDGLFLNTGTRHFVLEVPDAEAVDVDGEGRRIRWREDFAPEGTNVNFLSVQDDGSLRVRTFEKGVERETLACGTGVTASAIAAFCFGIMPSSTELAPGFPGARRLVYRVRASGGDLSVEFTPASPAPMVQAPCEVPSFHIVDIFLTGPAQMIRELN